MARNPIQFQEGLSLPDFLEDYGTEAQCRAALERMRWPDGFQCPHCGGRRHSFHLVRRLYRCADCRVQTSVTAGTIFHHSKLALSKWFLAIYWMTQTKFSISALALSRVLGVQLNTARLLRLKLGQVMLERNEAKLLKGRVEMDDAYLGGERQGGKPGRGSENKHPFPDRRPGPPPGKPVRGARSGSIFAVSRPFPRSKSKPTPRPGSLPAPMSTRMAWPASRASPGPAAAITPSSPAASIKPKNSRSSGGSTRGSPTSKRP